MPERHGDMRGLQLRRLSHFVIVQLYKQYWSSGAACPERLVVSAVEPSRRKLRAKKEFPIMSSYYENKH